jgi:hypothetical protein
MIYAWQNGAATPRPAQAHMTVMMLGVYFQVQIQAAALREMTTEKTRRRVLDVKSYSRGSGEYQQLSRSFMQGCLHHIIPTFSIRNV